MLPDGRVFELDWFDKTKSFSGIVCNIWKSSLNNPILAYSSEPLVELKNILAFFKFAVSTFVLIWISFDITSKSLLNFILPLNKLFLKALSFTSIPW